MVNYRVVMAVLCGIGFVGCGGGSQAGLDPSAGGQALQPSGHGVHRAANSFTWDTGRLDVPANGDYILEHACRSGTIVVSGAWSKKAVEDNDDLTVEEQYPSNYTAESAWYYVIKNTANRQESFKYYVLCATAS